MSRSCVYTYQKNNIHQLVFLESTQHAVNQFIAYLDRICTTEDAKPLLLIDFTQSGIPPVDTFVTQVNKWHSIRFEASMKRCAIIYHGTGMTLSLLENMVQHLDFFDNEQTQCFQQKYLDTARTWLTDISVSAEAQR